MLERQYITGNENLIDIAIMRLKEFEPPEGYYGAFSGGKDSIVIKELVRLSGVKCDWHYNWTTVDPPEVLYFIKEFHPDVIIEKPKMSMWQLIVKKHILPTRMIRFCCSELKERGGAGRRVITGLRWAESNGRSKRKMFEAQKGDKLKYLLNPIIEWSDSEVWEFIKLKNIPYCKLYDEGFTRLGCIMCPMTTSTNKKIHAKRWPKHYAAYVRAADQCIKDGITSGKLHKSKTGKQMVDVWMNDYVKPNSEECFFSFDD